MEVESGVTHMGEKVVYEVARYNGWDDDAELIERVQLVSVDGVLKLRDGSGAETTCEGSDAVAVISSTPALREIRDEQEARINCMAEIVSKLPFALEPVTNSDELINLAAKVNGDPWSAFRTDDGELAMLPGGDPEDEPDMAPCWAEFQFGEGEDNPLIGSTSIGTAMPGVAIEYAGYDNGGFGSESAVAIRPFDDFATVFVDWLLNVEVLGGIWGGDSSPGSPGPELFETAAAAADRKAWWNNEADDEDGDDEDEEGDYEEVYYEADLSRWAFLKLHLPDSLIEEVRDRLIKTAKQPS